MNGRHEPAPIRSRLRVDPHPQRFLGAYGRTAVDVGHWRRNDSTIFSTLFGGDESLQQFWKNIATAK